MGDDSLNGGNGNDILFGDGGRDTLFGEVGNYIFAIQLGTNSDRDTIRDFVDGSDRLGLTIGLTFGDLSILDDGSGNTRIQDINSNVILATVQGVDSTLIDINDFVTL